jgi:CHAT domain-containing protein
MLGNQLYKGLMAAHEPGLAGVTTIDVYTDGVLADLPLSLLADNAGRFIVDRFAMRHVVPAASRSSVIAEKMSQRGPLLIGNPSWKRSDFPGLEPLRWADEEVQQIAMLYPRHTRLSGAGATKSALLNSMPHHDVIHFAGHSRIVVEDPSKSHLVLAGGKTFGDGVLYASEIAQLDLRGVKLVVLSSCGRTRDDASAMGEVNGLALAFLDAGVEAVVASLWDVEDETVGKLMEAMHRELSGHNAEDALQRAKATTAELRKDFATSIIGAFTIAGAPELEPSVNTVGRRRTAITDSTRSGFTRVLRRH